MAEVKNYDADPDALAWARAKIQTAVDRAEAFAQKGGPNAQQWRKTAGIMRMWLLPTDEGCVIGPFDSRLAKPEVQALLAEIREAKTDG